VILGVAPAGPFSEALAAAGASGRLAVIPDIKCCSPKEGDLLQGRDPVQAAQRFVVCGAPVLSVVTEPERFGGSPELLRAITDCAGVPVLRKDFITDAGQLIETARLGAAAVLLICAIVGEQTLRALYLEALSRGLEPLVEAHTARELTFAVELGARLVGINNRDITAGERDEGGAELTAELAAQAPADRLLVSESGIGTAADARRAAEAGADAVLVGTALWRTKDPAALYEQLRVPRTQRKG